MKFFSLLRTTAVVSLVPFMGFAQNISINSYLESNLPNMAVRNILESEQIFCYTVEMPSENYQGYTIDQMAVTGFCGVLNQQQKEVLVSAFLKDEKSLSRKSADCTIVPKVLIRFMRGIDSTDVLFSSPCPSLTFFYGGGLKSFNAEPSEAQIIAISDVFGKGKVDFVSPALLDQVFPIGIPQTDEQKALVAKHNAPKPSSKWAKTPEQAASAQSSKETNQPAKANGWNKININKK